VVHKSANAEPTNPLLHDSGESDEVQS
jgi:hypothetical protein